MGGMTLDSASSTGTEQDIEDMEKNQMLKQKKSELIRNEVTTNYQNKISKHKLC